VSWFRRLLRIAVAYVAASVVAGAILAPAILYSPESALGPVDAGFFVLAAWFLSLVSGMVAALALAPTLLLGFYAERNAIRSPLFYALAGGAVGLGVIAFYAAMVMWGGDPPPGIVDPALKLYLAGATGVVAFAGIVAGLVYRAIAGRKAGGSRAAQ
jgi:hypothetical protein